jgi:DNA invertase Pin-like site-specific DNA recombinase
VKAHAYGRVSSRSQTLEMQRAAVERAASTRGDSLKWFEEKASGRSLDRPELTRLRSAVRAGHVRAMCDAYTFTGSTAWRVPVSASLSRSWTS